MPEFTVPKFISRESKILGPLTFKQTMMVLTGAGICLVLYFTIAEEHLLLFIFACIIIMGGIGALAFLKIKGYPILTFLRNLSAFSLSSKLFLWRRKIVPPKVKKVEKLEEKKVEEGPTLRIGQGGRLQRLSTQIETKQSKKT